MLKRIYSSLNLAWVVQISNLLYIAHVVRSLTYCGCKPLVKVLFEMQFLASGGKTPSVAINFAMLNYLHVTKMIEQTATHGFAQIANIINEEVRQS